MILSNTDRNLQNRIFISENKYISKIAVIGDSGVGKTSLIKRITTNTFDSAYNMTIGGDFATTKIPLKNGKYCTYIFSDVSGQSRFKETRQVFYTSADLVIAVCDLTRKQSLINLERLWIPEFLSSYPIKDEKKLKIQIMGNKSDLTDYSVIGSSDLEEVAFRIATKFPQITVLNPSIITSAKNNIFEIKSSRKQIRSVFA